MKKTPQNKTTINPQLFEQEAWQKNTLVCGIDEAGRGCLAGPVVTAAAVLKPGVSHHLLKDSKVLSPRDRETAFAWIKENAWYAVGIGTPEEIETLNILETTRRKMTQAFINLMEQEKWLLGSLKFLLIDAVALKLPASYLPPSLIIDSFPFGESRSISIAAASIVAKVTRDALMDHLDPLFPSYKLAAHKGYGTAQHQEALQSHGRSPIHRHSFLKNFETHKNTQLSIG